MSGNEVVEFVCCFHADRAREDGIDEAPTYPGITKAGEKRTREKAKIIAGNKISRLPEGAVVILSGVSRAVRTKSTLAVYADELERLFEEKPDAIFFNLAKNFPNAKERLMTLVELSKEINNGNRKKIAIFHIPLVIDKFIASPSADEEEAGQLMLTGMEELEEFFKQLFPESPLCLVSVGHSGALNGLFHLAIKERKKGFSFI